MKPVVGVMQAWSCIVISVFGVVILSIIGTLFKSNNHALLGGKEDPDHGAAVAATVFSAVVVYAVRLVKLLDGFGPSSHPSTLNPSRCTN
ncbi:hypothetical protein DSL72_001717 [Monilinia vaccinii-corymbosi]|uniref:Uncharacterized protein n=1 Tax=Monilinia vaccinii-corymbosi TaxID=61207 RepID=A0A8A3PAP3_9HELO|nr:hypothetical protein DSL72_001717 [Monilinia vaccinii-corymbosi]